MCHGLLGRGHDLQPPVLGCPVSRGRSGGVGVRAEGSHRQVAERSRAHVPPGRRRALQRCRRGYAKTAAAVPHAYHMPSHIFTRLGYWDEATTTNENAWKISTDDVKAAGEPGELRDFHALNYLSYNYLQLGRYKDAKKAVDLF